MMPLLPCQKRDTIQPVPGDMRHGITNLIARKAPPGGAFLSDWGVEEEI